jgi:hypothetical protein
LLGLARGYPGESVLMACGVSCKHVTPLLFDDWYVCMNPFKLKKLINFTMIWDVETSFASKEILGLTATKSNGSRIRIVSMPADYSACIELTGISDAIHWQAQRLWYRWGDFTR